MGLSNFLIQRAMKKDARLLAEWAAELYQTLKVHNPNDTDEEIFGEMLGERMHFRDEDDEKRTKARFCSTIEGVCYYLGMEFGVLRGAPIFRCVQFTQYVDEELYNRGFNKQSIETKRRLFKELGLPEDSM